MARIAIVDDSRLACMFTRGSSKKSATSWWTHPTSLFDVIKVLREGSSLLSCSWITSCPTALAPAWRAPWRQYPALKEIRVIMISATRDEEIQGAAPANGRGNSLPHQALRTPGPRYPSGSTVGAAPPEPWTD